MRILLNISLILCNFFSLGGSQSADGKITKPTRLTGHGTKVTTIQIQDFDQCFPRDAAKTFGLEFRLPRQGGGRCEDGLIICYPSIMATGILDNDHSVDTVDLSNEMFNIDNMDNNPIAEECQNEAKKLGNSMAKLTWHGIGIKLNRQGDSMSTAILHTSFSEKRFIVPELFRKFNIHLGNKNNFSAYITVDEQVIEVEDAKVEQYKKMALIGAKMRDFVGFWVLGLDMIPWDEQRMRFFVIRHCNCSLEAWFLRPSDSDPTDPKKASMGTGRFEDRCDNETQKLTMPIAISEVNQVISIRLLADKMLSNTITLKLLNSKGVEMLNVQFFLGYNFVKVTTTDTADSNLVEQKFSNRTFEMNLQIWLKPYSYKILLKNRQLGNKEYYPKEWWKGLECKDHNKLTLDGHYALIDEPRVFPRQAQDELSTTVSYYSFAPWSERSLLRARIKLLDGDTTHFNIYLLHDAIEPVENLGATVMRLEVTVSKENVSKIDFSEFYKNDKIPFVEYSKGIESQFNKFLNNGMRAFEFKIKLSRSRVNLSINGVELSNKQKRQLPAWATNYIRLKREWRRHEKITKIDPNAIFLVKAKTTKDNKTMPDEFTIKLPTLFNYGDSVRLDTQREKGAINESNNNFTFIFMHESLDENQKIGDTLMKLEYFFVLKGNQFSKEVKCSSHLNQDKKNPFSTGKHDMSEYGGASIIQITAYSNQFWINVNDEKGGHKLDCWYPTTTVKGKNVTIPPWAVDHIRIRGNNYFGEIKFYFLSGIRNEGKRITALRQINATNGFGFLETGDRINVMVKSKDGKMPTSSVKVFFLNEALEFNEIIGKTIMKAEVHKKQLTLSHYINGTWNGTINCTAVKLTETYKFEFIVVSNTGFNVSVNEVKDCAYRIPLPLWTIQYISVDYTKWSFHPPIITCHPSKRCFKPTSNNSNMFMEFPEKKGNN
ncbi:hypothetical protein niasHT_014160 [Heterodera trifolii]|uniref:Galectin domain-containing protein n=1 Tax=Heterodera trifolii TaxID=157864 RepID=A0ABD2KX67_9BILA